MLSSLATLSTRPLHIWTAANATDDAVIVKTNSGISLAVNTDNHRQLEHPGAELLCKGGVG